MNIAKARLNAQHLSGDFLESPEAVVWGIGLRLRHAAVNDAERAGLERAAERYARVFGLTAVTTVVSA